MACAVSWARVIVLATMSSRSWPSRRRPSPRACSQPRSDSRSQSFGRGSPVRSYSLPIDSPWRTERAPRPPPCGRTRCRSTRRGGRSGRSARSRADPRQEELVQPRLARQLRMERDDEHVVLPRGHHVALDLGEHLDVVAAVLDPRRTDEHGAHGRALDAGDVEVGFEGPDLAAECVAPAGVVGEPEVLAVEHDHPGARTQHRRAGPHEVAQRLGEALAGDAERHRGRLPARDHEPVEALEVAGHAYLADLGAEPAQHAGVRLEVALEGEDADQRSCARLHPVVAVAGADRRGAHQPRFARSWRSSSLRVSSDVIAWPRPSDARATRSASWKCVVASTMAAARRAGSSDLKMPEPTNTPSAPSCITSDASAGVAIPPAQNTTTGSFPASATPRTMPSGA